MTDSKLDSTVAKVSDIQSAAELRERYWANFDIHLKADDGAASGTITIVRAAARPLAITRMELHDRGAQPALYDDGEEWAEVVEPLLAKYGDDGFVALLRELVPLLVTPLIVVWHRKIDGAFDGAAQWAIWPGCPFVRVQQVDPLPVNKAEEGHG
ncbi:MAG TPA: hypothetical protein VGL72_10105 [Bryobacteraceae bacterium]|jgi:hypothetical protein